MLKPQTKFTLHDGAISRIVHHFLRSFWFAPKIKIFFIVTIFNKSMMYNHNKITNDWETVGFWNNFTLCRGNPWCQKSSGRHIHNSELRGNHVCICQTQDIQYSGCGTCHSQIQTCLHTLLQNIIDNIFKSSKSTKLIIKWCRLYMMNTAFQFLQVI